MENKASVDVCAVLGRAWAAYKSDAPGDIGCPVIEEPPGRNRRERRKNASLMRKGARKGRKR